MPNVLDVVEYTRMSSIDTMKNVSRHSLNTHFISSTNTTGALVRPKDMTTNLEWSYHVLNAAFGTYPLFLNMVITWLKIYLGEHGCFSKLVEKIFDTREWILVLHYSLV